MSTSIRMTTRPLGHPHKKALCLRHIATDRFKSARLSLVTVRPAHETESPLATLLYGILRRGSERYPRLALFNRRLDELYGTTLTIRNYLHGDEHIISLTAEMPEDRFLPPADREMGILDGVMELLSELILHPLLDGDGLLRQDAVEAEKQSLCDSLLALANDTRAYAGDRFRRVMCPDEPYGLSVGGTVESVMRITPAEVTAHWRRHLERARCEVFYVGRASVDEVAALWDKHFGAWNPAPLDTPPTKPHRPPTVPGSVEELWPVAQGKLCMGWSCGESESTLSSSADEAALLVCNELFGVMQSSLLFRHVRERLGLCYYCESALDLTKGILWVASGIRSDRRDEAEAAIRSVWMSITEGAIRPDDVEQAKRSLENGYRQIEDSQGAMESYFTGRILRRDGDVSTPQEQLAAIRAVTVEDVARAARRFTFDTVYFLKGTATAEEGEEDDDADA